MHIVGEGPIFVMALFRPLDDIQWTSKPSRIDWHIKKVDPSLLNDQNLIMESQDMFFLRHVKFTENRDFINFGLFVLNCIKTEVKITQWTFIPPSIDGHIKLVDLSLLNDENWIRESQDMCFHRHAKLTENSDLLNLGLLVKTHILALPDPIFII